MSMSSSPFRPFGGLQPSQIEHLECYVYYGQGTAVYYPLSHLDSLAQSRIVSGIHGGVRIGTAVVLGSILLLLARTYRSVMFCFYQTNFILMIISSSLQLAWLFTFNASIAQFVTNGDIPYSDLGLSVASSFSQMLLIVSLLATLVMQIYVACSDMRRPHQILVTTVGATACFPSWFLWFWRFVLVAKQDLGPNRGLNVYISTEFPWVYKGAWPAFAASTSACSLILCVKLWTVHRRRAMMGIQRFDPVKTLLTIAAQNSVVPAILAIVSAGLTQDSFGQQSVSAATIPVTATFLPFGYIIAQYHMLTNSPPSQLREQDHREDSDQPYAEYERQGSLKSPASEKGSFTSPF